MNKTKESTPTQTLAQGAKKEGSKIDALGRRITVVRLDALQYYNVIKVLGQTAQNEAAVDFAMIAATVRKIDATSYPMPTSERDIQFVIQQLDFQGIAAAGEALKDLTQTTPEDDQSEGNAAKN